MAESIWKRTAAIKPLSTTRQQGHPSPASSWASGIWKIWDPSVLIPVPSARSWDFLSSGNSWALGPIRGDRITFCGVYPPQQASSQPWLFPFIKPKPGNWFWWGTWDQLCGVLPGLPVTHAISLQRPSTPPWSQSPCSLFSAALKEEGLGKVVDKNKN